MPGFRPARGREAGVMLIEALIAILIFSIGILAVVGMQSVALKNATESKHRSEAAFLAQELMAQMWIDQSINPVTKINTSNVNPTNYDYPGTGSPPPRLVDWVDRVNKRLPGTSVPGAMPKVTITNPTASGATVRIEIFWRLPEEATLGLPPHSHTVVASVQV
ncbi:MAG: type IV pilus modification protein PilV [Burkholderiales bacterium]